MIINFLIIIQEKMTNTEKEYTMEELVQLINSQENDFIIEISLEGDDE